MAENKSISSDAIKLDLSSEDNNGISSDGTELGYLKEAKNH